MKSLLFGIAASLLLGVVGSEMVHASGLKIQPLLYKETITNTDRKRGFVDVSNPTGQSLTIKATVKGFRQLDNGKRLEFYDSKQLREAIIIEKSSFEIKPRQAIRIYFGVDAKKLPGGDVLAALTFRTVQPDSSKNKNFIEQSVGVGTLITLISANDANHNAEIIKQDIPFLQLGQKLSGSYTVKNTAPIDSPSAFYPTVEVTYRPFGKTVKQQGGLLSAGVVRTNEFSSRENMFGLYQVEVRFKDSVQKTWVFAILGWGWAIAVSIFSLLGALTVVFFKLREHRPKHT